jgi:DNA replication protein DnaC
LPFEDTTEVFGSERLTGVLLDRLTHQVQVPEVNGEIYRIDQSRRRRERRNKPSASSPKPR